MAYAARGGGEGSPAASDLAANTQPRSERHMERAAGEKAWEGSGLTGTAAPLPLPKSSGARAVSAEGAPGSASPSAEAASA